jgi:hypothetical protein
MDVEGLMEEFGSVALANFDPLSEPPRRLPTQPPSRYDPALARILRSRPRRGRHFPVMTVIPPGLDFSNLKVDCPPDPWQQLAAASAVSGPRSRRASVASGNAAAAAAAAVAAAADGGGGSDDLAASDQLTVKAPAAKGSLDLPLMTRKGSSPFLQALPEAALASSGPGSAVAPSPRAPLTPLGGSGVLPTLPPAVFEDPPIWQDIFK